MGHPQQVLVELRPCAVALRDAACGSVELHPGVYRGLNAVHGALDKPLQHGVLDESPAEPLMGALQLLPGVPHSMGTR
jgi:hypothetical protein